MMPGLSGNFMAPGSRRGTGPLRRNASEPVVRRGVDRSRDGVDRRI